MKKIKINGFVYIWRDKKHKRYYIGSRWGKEDDGYICSSNWMRDAYKRRPLDFKRRILNNKIANRTELYEKEQYWFNFIRDEEIGKKYYNLTKSVKSHWSIDSEKRLTVGQKIGLKHKGRSSPWTEGPMSEETKEKLRKARANQFITDETKEKLSIAGKLAYKEGRRKYNPNSHSEESNLKRTKALKLAYKEGRRIPIKMEGINNPFFGKKHTEETRLKMSISASNRNRKRKILI